MTSGYVQFIIVTILFSLCLLDYQLTHRPEITDIKPNSTGISPLLFMTLSMCTSITTSLVFGKPFMEAYIGLVIFVVMVTVTVVVPELWEWCERAILTIIPCIFGGQYL